MISREIEIELRLTKQLSGSEFERFGNQYLRYHYKDKYPQTKLGLQIANNSTVAGQPDMYFSLPGYAFRFAEFTSQKGGLYTKLKKDVKSCLDAGSHGIGYDQIKHIDLVYAGRLKGAKQEIEIAKPARTLGISVTFHGLDKLVNAVEDDIRLAKPLGIPIDTGQILTAVEFIEYYERSRLAVGTPLSNAYLERTEYERLTDQLNISDIVVIQGKPGCGKTKLALEYIHRYTVNRPGSEGYCIVNQPPAIWDDVLAYFPDNKDYVILIDDANRQVDNLLTILNHFNKRLRSSTYKILITVRGYAYEEVCQSLRNDDYQFSDMTVGQMTDEQITEVLKSPSFTILNSHYHYKINQLVRGNVRLAIILATLANKKGSDITILSDISAVYDEYYRRVMPDQTVWTDVTCLRVLGLIAVLRVVDTTDPTAIEPILAFLDITVAKLWRHIRYLEKLEIIEVYQDNAFRFTEQVFATYAFYQCFFIRKALDLTKLLATFNEINGYRLKDSILSVYESYNKESVRVWVQPILTKFYATLTDDRVRLIFLSMYYRFLLDEIVFFIHDFVEGHIMTDTINRWGKNSGTEIVALLFEFLRHTNKKTDALTGYELTVALINKQGITLEDVSKKIENYLAQSLSYVDDEEPCFEKYDWLSAYLIERGLQDSVLHCQIMDCTLKHFLLLMYDKPGEPAVYRNRIWKYIDCRLSVDIDIVKKAIYDYIPKSYGDLSIDYIQNDIDEVTKVIRKHFSSENPLDCRNVHAYVNKLDKLPIERRTYQTLAAEFNGELYRLYCTLSFEYIKKRQRTEINIVDSSILRQRKIDEIRTMLSFDSLDDFKLLYGKIRKMWSLVVLSGDGWYLSEGLTEYLLSIAERNSVLFIDVFAYIVSIGFPDSYMDHAPLLSTIIGRNNVRSEDLYTILQPVTEKTASWLLSLFWSLPESEINTHWFSLLNKHLSELAMYRPDRIAIPGFLNRYVAFDSTLPSRVLQLLCDIKIEYKKDIYLWNSFIEEFGLQIDTSLTTLLEKLYLSQYLTKQAYDYDRKALAVLINRRRGFWLDFLSAHYSEEGYTHHDFGQLSFVWSRDDHYELIVEGLQFIEQQKIYMIRSREVDGFFERLDSSDTDKINPFLERFIRENSRNLDLLNAIYIALKQPDCPIDKSFINLFLTNNKSVEDFTRIDWIKSSSVHTYSAGTIISDLRAKQWEDILLKIEGMDDPLTYLPHKRYIKQIITHELEYGKHERRENFLRSGW